LQKSKLKHRKKSEFSSVLSKQNEAHADGEEAGSLNLALLMSILV